MDVSHNNLFDLLFEMPGLILDAEIALDSGFLDSDPSAKAQAEEDLSHARSFYSAILSEAWPEFIQKLP